MIPLQLVKVSKMIPSTPNLSPMLNPDDCGKEIEFFELRPAVIHSLPSMKQCDVGIREREEKRRNATALLLHRDPGNRAMQCGTVIPDCKVVDRICMRMTWRLAVSATIE
jgi:hypothetical protein